MQCAARIPRTGSIILASHWKRLSPLRDTVTLGHVKSSNSYITSGEHAAKFGNGWDITFFIRLSAIIYPRVVLAQAFLKPVAYIDSEQDTHEVMQKTLVLAAESTGHSVSECEFSAVNEGSCMPP
jgi:hypothetical protein